MILNGDALRLPIASGATHMVITSPPYFNARDYSQWDSWAGYLKDMALVWAECFRVLCDGGRIAVNVPQGYGRPNNGGYYRIGDMTATALEAAGFTLRGEIVWMKYSHGMAAAARGYGTAWGSWMSASDPCLRDGHELIIIGHRGSQARAKGEDTIDHDTFLLATATIWQIGPAAGRSVAWHPAPFPSEIPRRLIELYAFKGDVVLDPFSGTGTTERTALALGRRAIGVELNPAYATRSLDRFPQPVLVMAD
jgi:site-specific DNA-methyltransferase (adenine-specific)